MKYKITFKNFKVTDYDDNGQAIKETLNPSYIIETQKQVNHGALNLLSVFDVQDLIASNIPLELHLANPQHYTLKKI